MPVLAIVPIDIAARTIEVQVVSGVDIIPAGRRTPIVTVLSRVVKR